MTDIKICGITTDDALAAAHRAEFIGFVFHTPSPRAILPLAAGKLARQARPEQKKVGLFVNPTDADLLQVLAAVKLDMVQLHGDELPTRVGEVAALTGLPVMKAIRVATAADVREAQKFATVADWLLFDARNDAAYGGTGKSFDWGLLKNFRNAKPWMLSGGLNAANVASALAVLKPNAIDISSGVESAPGQKDPRLIKDFIASVPR